MTTVTSAYHAARAQRAAEPRTPREPLLTKAARFAGLHAPRWDRLRAFALQVTGFGLIDYGLFEANTIAGFIGTGVSLFVLDFLASDE